MNGLELARGYYREYGRPMLEHDFPELLPYIAVAFTGSGSEHYGFDDEISRDHDFEPGFCLFLPSEDTVDRRQAFLLERAYAKLPKEYGGVTRQPLSPVGGRRHGVMRTAEFFTRAVGAPDGELGKEGWLRIPDYALAEAVNGEVFFDDYGEFSYIREKLAHMPEDIRLKRIAGNLLLMAQAGQYNFSRCLRRGEAEAAQLACHAFVTAAIKVVFLLRGRTVPYYKWSFRALRELDGAEEIHSLLSFILCGADAAAKAEAIEKAARLVISGLCEQSLARADGCELEKYAYAVNGRIKDSEIRELNILAAVGS